ncbi:N-acetylglucosamine-6-phosphate deacetylase [Sphingopyxis sp. LC81]|jgi:N-acetylglucosamine-6-phosphate deacetylase|uniref:N-acetylglucosamine-6-phosphate deacetylase n=1 Tax=Sphingopyxis fribergensis TaxID=1515612 RepID=A0A0A7PUA5_9SPHN|nr:MULTISPECIES: N-acetylglucosamine-6-phosphate deacetylase [Sphingopyxis]QUM74653.1 N-acetylglucosamine-6-phosphate deacetylase [Sphingopyxis granuli]AJA11662.1 N-acetylglucosamine-6-phosphate deacetylase [Sphingopyxis fribergensis]KGB56441.1 N-acetylglucosamine-6-phosphate deacetylase [Sphingopyxis sp. LC81]KGB58436.1 N-acetylglucosamine-6-phosphate deacetylase [Sphingopyxis sp. LC363]PAL19305.1 N-acetylglucosamine-6-phosphate deacetylase [Sphingopyxis sp. GW247-27LB]
MTRKALIGARILSERGWRSDHALLIERSAIVDIVPDSGVPTDFDPVRLDGGMLVPGFIDTQVNGGGGVLFNESPTIDGIRAITEAHRAFGTTALLPTLISDDFDVIERGIAAVRDAIAIGTPGVLGIHIEGPFLNIEKKGIHDASKIRKMDERAVNLLSSLGAGKTLVTLAPEMVATGLIAELTARGVIVSAGHTLATSEDMDRAISEGLRAITHLFNAMPPLASRTPGVAGAGLASPLICGVIVDGHHVHPTALRAAFRAKGPDELMLVTDSMPTVGTDIDTFFLGETEIFRNEGALRSADGTLAGSDLDMARAIRNAVSNMHVELADACKMASATPAALLGLTGTYGCLAPRARADIVHLSEDIEIVRTWIGGE